MFSLNTLKIPSKKNSCLYCSERMNLIKPPGWEALSEDGQIKWAAARDFQQLDILTSVDSDEPVQPPVKLRNSKQCSVSSSTVIEYSSDKQRLWSVCAYAQAGLSLCWSHIPNCWKSHALAQIEKVVEMCRYQNIKKRYMYILHCKGDNFKEM